MLRADTSPLGLAAEHKETEDYIRASGVPFVLLRHSWYTENYTAGIPGALAHGAVYGCAGNGRISSATRADYAEADVAVLTADNQAGKVYELAGDTDRTHWPNWRQKFRANPARTSATSICPKPNTRTC